MAPTDENQTDFCLNRDGEEALKEFYEDHYKDGLENLLFDECIFEVENLAREHGLPCTIEIRRHESNDGQLHSLSLCEAYFV